MGILLLFPSQEDTIFIHIEQKVFDSMLDETTKQNEIETGGMMFGRISEADSQIKIEILRIYIPPDDSCIRKRSFFEIDPAYAKKVLASEEFLYLGNWHKHLGYGGPSSGDHQQIR